MSAQTNEIFEKYRLGMDKKFESEKDRMDRTFSEYRARINREFSTYLEREWSNIILNCGREYPFKPEPEPVVNTDPVDGSSPLPFNLSDAPPEPEEQPSPIEPIVADRIIPNEILPDLDDGEVVIPGDDDMLIRPDGSQFDVPYSPEKNSYISFSYLGNTCRVRAPVERNLYMSSLSNEAISKVWTILSAENYNDMLVDCICIRESLSLCDWAFYQMVKSFTKEYLSSDSSSEAVLVQAYILTQIGYKIRLSRQNEHLFLMLGSNSKLFSVPYCTTSEGCFYCFSSSFDSNAFQLCDFRFPGEKDFSMKMKRHPKTPDAYSGIRRVTSDLYPEAVASVRINMNLIGFYDSYPACSWEFLSASSLSEGLKNQLYPALEKVISGLSETQSVNMLLNLVQTGFQYKTDDEQFGREKSFFGDETFYYPYCDCEDRSILFSVLVRELVHLDVVLLDYPTHIATAVKFKENVEGDYFDIDGSKYVICDPTYIGAPIGKSMPEFYNTPANILTIDL